MNEGESGSRNGIRSDEKTLGFTLGEITWMDDMLIRRVLGANQNIGIDFSLTLTIDRSAPFSSDNHALLNIYFSFSKKFHTIEVTIADRDNLNFIHEIHQITKTLFFSRAKCITV